MKCYPTTESSAQDSLKYLYQRIPTPSNSFFSINLLKFHIQVSTSTKSEHTKQRTTFPTSVDNMAIKIGIELEFLVAYCSTEKTRGMQDTQDRRWPESGPAAVDTTDYRSAFFANQECLYKVCHVLGSHGFPVACALTCETNRERVRSVYGGQVVDLEGGKFIVWNRHDVTNQASHPRFQYWFITHEYSITGDMANNPPSQTPKGYSWFCLEINSPIIDDTAELNNGLPTLCAAIEELRRQIKIYVNQECGLHIHASPLNGALTHDVARGVAALTFLLERSVIYQACHPFRSGGRYCQPISEASRIGKGSYGFVVDDTFSMMCMNELREVKRNMPNAVEDEQSIFKNLHTLLAQQSLGTLSNGIKNQGDCKMGSALSQFGSIEFRYPEGSLDIEFIRFWVSLTRALFDIAMLPPGQFAKKLAEVYRLSVSTDTISSDPLLDAVGLAGQWKDYFRGRLRLYRSKYSLNKHGILPPGRD